MNVAPVLGKSYNIHVIEAIEEFDERSPILSELVAAWLSRVVEKYTREDILNAMQIGTGRVFICMGEKNGLGVSLLTAHPVLEDGVPCAMVNIGYLDYNHVNDVEAKNIKHESLEALKKWAIDRKMKSLLMQSSHKEESWDRLLRPEGWKRIMTVYEKELTDGQQQIGSQSGS